jgi:hypothetical protein
MLKGPVTRVAGAIVHKQGGYMNVLKNDEICGVGGGNLAGALLAIGGAALAFKQAYETATWYGADDLGEWASSGWYTANEMCGSGAIALYGR